MSTARTGRCLLVLAALLVLVVVAAVASVAFGARVVSAAEVVGGLTGTSSEIGAIAVAERLPRTVTALVAGAALGLSGALMQAVTRNPIADPGILGINMGASLAIVIGMAFFGLGSLGHFLWLGIIGGMATAILVYAVGSMGPGGTTPVKLALAGVATTAAMSCAVSAILLPRAQGLSNFRFWQVGGLGRGSWQALATLAPLLILAGLVGLALAQSLNSLALGDEMAVGLGVNVAATRLTAAGAGVVLCATITALTGPIGFVGLMVPHAARMLTTSDHRWLLPLSALGGAGLLTLADVVGRVINRPGEVAVGIITAFVGAPVLIAIARSARVRAL
ncbi:iron ABC transporter permease [Actinomyces slackii]|uniref:Ferric enterobactin transport system permease protein fepD n=1 Tax=Actinomyces slackii TaxID=52774 RepID=A0A3S4SSH9_9ACTO|nr:iron chelate uptake ABC transporter family permease subunit [Actinomyces slackii]VEG73979.1 Ferric enterobactin transport system permease protein fepD [Actinomyces slackii]